MLGQELIGPVVGPVDLIAVVFHDGRAVVHLVVGVGEDNVDMGDAGMFNAADLEQRYLPLATSGYVWICPAEGVLFEVQTAADLDLVPGSSADISTDANEAHGSQTTGLSSCELVTPVNNDVLVVEQVTAPDNDVTLVNARHLVRFTTTAFEQ